MDEPGNPAYMWPARRILERMNGGVHWINHLAHGSPTKGLKLYCRAFPAPLACGPSAPRPSVSDLDTLTNTDYFFVYSQACLCGRFDDNECVAEGLTTNIDHGAFAAIMNAREGWGTLDGSTNGPSQRYHRDFWDTVFGDQPSQRKSEYGSANQYSKERAWNTWGDVRGMRWCFYQLNLFGDPSLKILTPP
jgi:hypothetical protein